jgi:hypothetical protein
VTASLCDPLLSIAFLRPTVCLLIRVLGSELSVLLARPKGFGSCAQSNLTGSAVHCVLPDAVYLLLCFRFRHSLVSQTRPVLVVWRTLFPSSLPSGGSKCPTFLWCALSRQWVYLSLLPSSSNRRSSPRVQCSCRKVVDFYP